MSNTTTSNLSVELNDLMQEFKIPKPSDKEVNLKELIGEAEESFAKKDFTKASRQFQKLLRKPVHTCQSSLFAVRLGQCQQAICAKTNPNDTSVLRYFTLAHILDKSRPEIAFLLAQSLSKLKRYAEAYEKVAAYTVGEAKYSPVLHPYQKRALEEDSKKAKESADAKDKKEQTTTVSNDTLQLRKKIFGDSFSTTELDELRIRLLQDINPSLVVLDNVWNQLKAFYLSEEKRCGKCGNKVVLDETRRRAPVEVEVLEINYTCQNTDCKAFWNQLKHKSVVVDNQEAIDKLRSKLVTASTPFASSVPTATPNLMPQTILSNTTSPQQKQPDMLRLIEQSNKMASPIKLDDTYVPTFRIRVHQQASTNEVLCRELGKMAHYQNEDKTACYWTTPLSRIEWVVSSENTPKQDSKEVKTDVDVDVVLNCMHDQRFMPVNIQHIVFMDMEPIGNRNFLPHPWPAIDRSSFRAYLPRNNIEWHLPHTWKQLSSMHIVKRKTISIIVSFENRLLGHKQRIALVKYLDQHWPDDVCALDIFGRPNPDTKVQDPFPTNLKHYRGPLSASDKHMAYFDYHYTVAIENTYKPRMHSDNYFTEKFADGVLSECCVFYAGCSNLPQYVEPGSYIQLDPENFKKSLDIIVNAIKTNEWVKRIHAIRRTKSLLLNEIQFFPALEKLLLAHFTPVETLPNVKFLVLNLKRRSDRWNAYNKQVQDVERMNGNRVKFTVERFEAVEGRELVWDQELEDLFRVDEPFVPKRFFGNHGYLAAIVGTAKSFVNMFRYIAIDPSLEDNDAVFIQEDDVIFSPSGFMSKWNELWKILQNDTNWDLVYAGHTDLQPTEHDEFVYPGVEKLNTPSRWRRFNGAGNFGLIVRKRTAKKIVNEFLAKYRIQQPFDHWLIDRFDELCVYACRPALVVSLPYDPRPNTGNKDTDVQNCALSLAEGRNEWLKRTTVQSVNNL